MMGFVRRTTRITIGAALLAATALTVGGCGGSGDAGPEIGHLALGAAYDVCVAGETAFVSDDEGIAILDIGDIAHPRRVGAIPERDGLGPIAGFHTSGDTLFTYGELFAIHDVSDPAAPRLLARYHGRYFIGAAATRDGHAYLGYLQGGLEVLDLRDAAGLRTVGFAQSPGRLSDVAVSGAYAYAAGDDAGLEIFDIADPADPRRLGAVAGTDGARDISLAGRLLYLGCRSHGVRILDVSIPEHPVVTGVFDNGGVTCGVQAVGDRLFTVDREQGIEVFDVEDAAHVHRLKGLEQYLPQDLFSDGNHVFLADQGRDFVVLPMGAGEGAGVGDASPH